MGYVIRRYITRDGHELFTEWQERLRDNKAEMAIDRRLIRVGEGNLGDHKYLRDGVSELRIDVGPGYRIYFGTSGMEIVVLLCGGDKRTQNKDIERACQCWNDWQLRMEEEARHERDKKRAARSKQR